MTDLESAHQGLMAEFGWQQWQKNPAGIGNECTHWIYAALLEARALDFDRALHIQQTRDPYTWGRAIESRDMIAGDILQFSNFVNHFQFYLSDGTDSRYFTTQRIRGPRHTAMCGVTQSHTFEGQHLVLESHLHDPAYAVMTIRDSRIYTASFSVSLTRQQLAEARAQRMFPTEADLDWRVAAYSPALGHALETKPVWLRMRDRFEIDETQANRAFQRIARRQEPEGDVALMMRLHNTGTIRRFRPQASPARLAMDAAAFAAEKQRLIAMMIRTGRPGESGNLDPYDSDNKRARQRDNYFNWSFTPRQP